MKILIIGPKGFIGSSLFNALKTHTEYDVWGCDIVQDNEINNYFFIDNADSNLEAILKLTRLISALIVQVQQVFQIPSRILFEIFI